MNYAFRQEEFHFLGAIAVHDPDGEDVHKYSLIARLKLLLAAAGRCAGNAWDVLLRCVQATKRV
jgi:hypothetical protein